METISQILFRVANSLLIPDIMILLLLFIRSLLLAGSFYNQFMVKRRNDMLLNDRIKALSPATIGGLEASLPGRDNSLFTKYLRDMLSTPPSEAYSDFLISNYENEAEKDLALSKLLAKMGPVLGLIGTLIAMSPALVGLSTGDIAGMAYNMQVVFATTVVGLVVSATGLATLQFKQRWYAKDVNYLDYVSRILTSQIPNANENQDAKGR
ncbi:membrane protein [Bacteroidia bacterium]|nr:membrane protein [Bacteroidia bacterium]